MQEIIPLLVSFRDFIISCNIIAYAQRALGSLKVTHLAWLTISSYKSSGILLVKPVVRGMIAPAFSDGKFLNSWFGLKSKIQ